MLISQSKADKDAGFSGGNAWNWNLRYCGQIGDFENWCWQKLLRASSWIEKASTHRYNRG